MKSVAAATLLAATLVHPAAAVFKPRNKAELRAGINKCTLPQDRYGRYTGKGDCTTLAGTPVPPEQGSDTYGPIGDWDVSQVKDMSLLFKERINFNQDIGGWDVSQVTTMMYMFERTNKFNQDLSSWNFPARRSGGVDTRNMFNIAEGYVNAQQSFCGYAWRRNRMVPKAGNWASGVTIAGSQCAVCDTVDGSAINGATCTCGQPNDDGTYKDTLPTCSSGTGLVCDATDAENPICSKTVTCAAGKFADGDDCTDCSEGSYQDEAGAAGCKACGEDKLSVAGSTSASACFGVEEAAAALVAQEYKEVVDKAWEDARGQCSGE